MPFPPQGLGEMKPAMLWEALLREQGERRSRLESLLQDEVEAPALPEGGPAL